MGQDDEDEQEQGKQQRCRICGALSPATQTNYTLIGAKHAWRMVVELQPDGTRAASWYCRKCWERQKHRTQPDAR